MSDDLQKDDEAVDEVAALSAQLAEAQTQVARIRQAHARAAAEFEQSKARLERNHEQEMTRARLKIATRMFEVADNLDRVIEATQETHAKDALFQGVVLLRDQFFRALEEFHVVRIDPKGERFDPKLHEAISVLAVTSPAQNNQILEVLRPGYMAGGEMLRAAHVVVGRAEPPKP